MTNKPYNNGEWTTARFNSFIKSALRNASLRWPAKHRVKKAAWIKRGVYRCAGFGRAAHEVPAKEVTVDHILPIVDPKKGFVSWDELIERLFCDDKGLQVLCRECHQKKSNSEKRKRW